MPRSMMMLLLIMVVLLHSHEVLGRRGRGRGKTRSRVQIGLPITGKYRDPESDQYYNNHNVCITPTEITSILLIVLKFNKFLSRVRKYCWRPTSIWNMF